MLFKALPCFLWLAVSPVYAQNGQGGQYVPQPPPESIISISPPLQCGLVTKFAGHKIGEGCLRDATNVIYDSDVGVQSRKGYAQFNTTALTGTQAVRRLYNFDAPDGNQYVMAVSSNTIFSAGSSGVFTPVTGLSGLSSTLNTSCVQGLGAFWCVNQTDGLIYWTGTATATVSGDPAGSLINTFRNRLIIADVSGNQSRIYGSGHLSGTDWTTSSAATSPFIISIYGTNDGDKITCLMGTYSDAFMIGTESRIYALYGFDNDDFGVREISREVGCVDQTSVKEMDGSLYWLSRRGIERMRGTGIDWKASYPIIDIVQEIIDAAGNSQLFLDASQADFELGNLSVSGTNAAMSATLSPGNVVPSSWSHTDTSETDFLLGTLTFVSTLTTSGSLELDVATYTNVNFDNFSDGDLTANPIWTLVGSWSVTGGRMTYVSGGGTGLAAVPASIDRTERAVIFEFDAQNTGDTGFLVGSLVSDSGVGYQVRHTAGSVDTVQVCSTISNFTCTDNLINTPQATTSNVSYRLIFSTTSRIELFLDGVSIGTAATYTATSFTKVGVLANNTAISFDNIRLNYFESTGTWVSPIFDTAMSTPVWSTFTPDVNTPVGTSISFEIQASTDSDDTFESFTAQTSGAKIAAKAARYLRYQATLATTVSTQTPTFSSVELSARTTGYFISQARNPGTEITAWGLFQCNFAQNGGDFTFWIATGATANAATRSTATWNLQTNNTAISIATAPFVAYRVLFDIDAGTEVPTLQDCTINYEAGSARPEVAAGVHDHRYHLFYTSSTDSGAANINALVLDQFDRWSFWDSMKARSASRFRGDLLVGDGAATGKIYRLYTGNSDDGASITSRIRTRDFDGENWRAEKSFGPLFLELSPEEDSADDVNLTVNAYIDISNKYTLGTVNLNEDSGVIAARVPWPLDTQNTGRYISIELSNTGTAPWRFYRGALRNRVLREE